MANIKIFQKGVRVQISKNFFSTEFDCNCSYPECKETPIDVDHVAKLQEKRDKWGKSIKINSGYRCPRRNKEEGGASKSRHLVTDASDIVVSGMTPDEVADDCENFAGLGRYSTFTHVDSRPYKARWDFRKK